eukprot:gb/GEZJ01003998.1/.p1 GENE.gb/GEZJ01003998.1/~~gb/GEZJ01003998.1/.p1  ORF type:complete len:655 (-),score=109.05 gb/GEZJ01003998.1/:374-2338(-)
MTSELSPPKDTSDKLDNLSSTTGALIEAFDKILVLPYVDVLRLDALGDLSIADVVLDLKQKYQELQGNTLPFARDLYSYAGLQLQTIPTISVSLDLATYLNLNKVIIARHKIEALNVKKESETFRKTFVATLDVFENTIKELGEQIQNLTTQIQDTKDLQEKERAVAVVGGVFTFMFTVAAVLAIVTTAGAVGAAGASTSASVASTTAVQGSAVASSGFFTALGASIGAASGTSGLVGVSAAISTAALGALAETIISSIEAGNYERAVTSLESLKTSAENARYQLLEVVEHMKVIEDSLDDIVTVWTDVELSLSIIQSDVDSWSKENFSEELVAPTVEEWQEVRTAVAKYTSVVSGDRSLRSDENSDVQLSADRIVSLAGSIAVSELKSNLQAPDIEFNAKLSDLKKMREALHYTLSLPEVGNSLKSQTESAIRYLDETERGLGQLSGELSEFAKERLLWLDAFETSDGSQRVEMITGNKSVYQAFEEKITRAQDTEQKAFSFQSAVGLVNNTLMRIIGEKTAEQTALKRQLKSIEAKRRKKKWLWVVPVAGAVNEILDAANNIRGKIRKIRRDVQLISRSCQQIRMLSSTVSSSVKDSTLVVQTYSSILNDVRASADDAVLFTVLGSEIPADLFISIKDSWVELATDIHEFIV